jgi:anti-sigma-K factor RskA
MHWNMRKGTKMAPRRAVAVRDRKRLQSARQAVAKLNKARGVLSRLSSWRERRCARSAIRCLAASAESLGDD